MKTPIAALAVHEPNGHAADDTYSMAEAARSGGRVAPGMSERDRLATIVRSAAARAGTERQWMADVLRQGVQGISELITEHGLINLDFADVRSVMGEMGKAMMGTGEAEGDRRAGAHLAQPAMEEVRAVGGHVGVQEQQGVSPGMGRQPIAALGPALVA